MKYLIPLFFLLIFVSCSNDSSTQKAIKNITTTEAMKVIQNKNLSLVQKDALKYFFYTEGIDKTIQEPYAEVESKYFYDLQDSTKKFIHFDSFKKSSIVQITDRYILALLNLNEGSNSLAGTFALNGTPINFLLLEKSFGNNEFSISRVYKFLNKNTFMLSDERYDTEWIVYPTKGINKLSSHSDINITINKEGLFLYKKALQV